MNLLTILLKNNYHIYQKKINMIQTYIPKGYENEIPVSPTPEPGTGSTQYPTPQTSRVQL